jgi:hypothetical protein
LSDPFEYLQDLVDKSFKTAIIKTEYFFDIAGCGTINDSANAQELKKALFRVYNEVNKEIYGSGVVTLRITVSGESIMFFTRHNRVQALKALEDRYFVLKQSVDHALFQEFKLRLGEKLKDQLDIHPKALLRDYDPDSKIAVTIVFLKDNLSEDQ